MADDGTRGQSPGAKRWPFLIDQWGLGNAYQCKAAECGIDVMLYLRAKVGFCNCTTGIAEDDEIDRVGDLALSAGSRGRARPATPVTVGWMKGRSRAFVVEGRDRRERHALTVAVSNKCDARGRNGGCGSADFVRYRAGRENSRQHADPAWAAANTTVAHDPEKWSRFSDEIMRRTS